METKDIIQEVMKEIKYKDGDFRKQDLGKVNYYCKLAIKKTIKITAKTDSKDGGEK